jgi:hypothetical protein
MDVYIVALQSRLEKLERANRRMRLLGITALILGATALLLNQNRKGRVIEAEQFILTDGKGEKRGGMIVTSQGPGP